jgi:predicted transcriptional regulator
MDIQKVTPTTAELEILTILWENEPLTVKEIHEKLIESKDIGYTTALKIMQNMTIKGLLRREPNGKTTSTSRFSKKKRHVVNCSTVLLNPPSLVRHQAWSCN